MSLIYLVDYIIIVIDRILLAYVYEEYVFFCLLQILKYLLEEVGDMEVVSGTLFAMEASIRAKLLAVGATSRNKAATVQEAHLDVQEQNWLHYIAGGLFARVKKTKDERFYVAVFK